MTYNSINWPKASSNWPIASSNWPIASSNWPIASNDGLKLFKDWPIISSDWPKASNYWPIAYNDCFLFSLTIISLRTTLHHQLSLKLNGWMGVSLIC